MEKKISITLLLIGMTMGLSFRSFAQLEDYDGLGIYYRFTANSYASNSDMNSLSYHGFGVDFMKSWYDESKTQLSYRNRVLGEFVSLIFPGSFNKIVQDGPQVSSGFLGWLNVGRYVWKNEYLAISPGIALHDYVYAAENNEPNGYYLAAGPALFVDFALKESPLGLHFEASYAGSTRVSAQESELGDNFDRDAENPHFVNIQVEARYKQYFLAVSPVFIVNRYEPTQHITPGSRLDLMIGFRI